MPKKRLVNVLLRFTQTVKLFFIEINIGNLKLVIDDEIRLRAWKLISIGARDYGI